MADRKLEDARANADRAIARRDRKIRELQRQRDELLESLIALNAALAAQAVGAPLPREQVAEYQRRADAAVAKAEASVDAN